METKTYEISKEEIEKAHVNYKNTIRLSIIRLALNCIGISSFGSIMLFCHGKGMTGSGVVVCAVIMMMITLTAILNIIDIRNYKELISNSKETAKLLAKEKMEADKKESESFVFSEDELKKEE